ncbi:MAG: fasciclin domain-containing protein [Bacteroidales bacterium]|nr:fasciclin domain-containing protein [Bacteroidales bacterium]
MKTKSNFKTILSIVAVITIGLFTLTSCQKDDDNNMNDTPKSIAAIASADPQFSILVQALTKANLATTLSNAGTYTVFAPTNDAFNALFTKLGVSGIDQLSADALRPILLYHVLGSKAVSTGLSSGYVSTLSPAVGGRFVSLKVDVASGVKLNSSAMVSTADIMASNGVIHVIDQVLLPPTVADLAVANSSFTTLVSALSGAGLVPALSDPAGTFTVFAPTNDAFAALSELPSDLKPILLYHVLGSTVYASEVGTGYAKTLSTYMTYPMDIYLNTASGVKINNSANVVLTDVVGTNGVIHVIDHVLIPPTVVGIAVNNSSFSTLVSAVVKAGLAETLNGVGPFTVFAPTNDAFTSLFNDLGVSGVEQLTAEQLTPILLYHVVAGNNVSSGLVNGDIPTLQGTNIMVNVGKGVVLNGNTNVVVADVQGSNGVVHAIDKVLLPSGK